jgi:hypothetical protein
MHGRMTYNAGRDRVMVSHAFARAQQPTAKVSSLAVRVLSMLVWMPPPIVWVCNTPGVL